MSLYERYRVEQSVKTDMPDLPMKPPTKAQFEKSAVRRITAKSTTRRRSTSTTRSKTARVGSKPVKPLPPMHGDQPRDALGRFARKTGQVLWGAAKATGKAVVGTAKALHRTHKAVKRAHAGYKRRARLEEREQRITLAEREKKLGLRRKKIRRRKR